MHQNPHHLSSEHALSLPCHKGGHRWSPVSHAMGTASTKCCCSSCVRDVPCSVNAFSLDCSHGCQCQWAQPCICLCWFCFLLKLSQKVLQKTQPCCVLLSPSLLWARCWCRICYCCCSVFIVTQCCALILQHPVVMECHPCSPNGDIPSIPFLHS